MIAAWENKTSVAGRRKPNKTNKCEINTIFKLKKYFFSLVIVELH